MKMNRRTRVRRGWLITEAVIALSLLLIVITLVVAGVGRYTKVRDEAQWRRVALYAAEAQLVRIRAGADPETPPPAGCVPPEIKLTATTKPAAGDWAGFDLVEVRATADLSPKRRYEEVVKGYIPHHDSPEEVRP